MNTRSRVITALLLTLSGAASPAIQYTYDDLNRLTRVQYEDGRSIQYTYDAASNLLQVEHAAPGWCAQTLGFDQNTLPSGWAATVIRGGPGVQSEKLYASPVNSGVMLDSSAAAVSTDVRSIVVDYDSFRSDSTWGQFNSVEFRTAAGTRWRFDDVNGTFPGIGIGKRRFDVGLYSGPFYGGALTSGYQSVTKPLGVGTFRTRLTLTDATFTWAVTDAGGAVTTTVLAASPGFRIADLVGAGVVAYTTTDGPTWMDNISFACNR